jgi:hypothetical protein
LSPPPHDGGVVVPHDHLEILNGDDIIRRISKEQCINTPQGGRRVSSIAFQPSSGPQGGMSIDIKKSIEEAGLAAADFVTTPRWVGSAVFKADLPRSLSLMVGYEPIPGNPPHGELWGQFDRKISKALQRGSQWFVQIQGVALA